VTNNTPAGSPPKRTSTPKASAPATTPAAKAPAAKATAAKAPAAKTPVAKGAVAKGAVAKAPAAKPAAVKAPTVKPAAVKAPAAQPAIVKPAAKTPAAKATAAQTTKPAATVTPVVAPVVAPAVTPVVASVAPAAATAPAGWYPVVAGSPQQRWWDGTQWTEHIHDPRTAAAQAAAARPATVQPATTAEPPLRAAPGVRPGTVWFWLLAVGAPVLTILDLIPTSIYLSQVVGGDATDPTAIAANTFNGAYVLVLLANWFIYAVCIVFALLDWRELKAHGVPRPFHWAWSFFVLIVGWPAVYMIGRAVVVKRRTGAGLAPLWVFIGLEVVAFIVSLVVVVTAIIQVIALLSDGASGLGNVL